MRRACVPCERTTECYSIANDQFITFLRNKGLTDTVSNFTPENCEAFAKYLAAAGLKPNSTNVKLSALSSLAAFAMKAVAAQGANTKLERGLVGGL